MKGRYRKPQPSRKMKPVFIVFCEGETEENYLNFLKQNYRSPIKIISKVEGCSISKSIIQTRIKETKIASNERLSVFLMYDMDVNCINQKLSSIDAIKLLSNPCLELWFLLHTKKINGAISTEKIISTLKELNDTWKNYEKPNLTETQKTYLWENKTNAICNAKSLQDFENPSSTVYKLLEEIEKSLVS